MSRPTMLSIDWDFFLYRGAEVEDGKIVVFPGTDKEEEIHALQLFDWQHAEGRSAAIDGAIWASRYAALVRVGLDPLTVCGPPPGSVQPRAFIDALIDRYDMKDAHLLFSDSHALGFLAVSDAKADGPPVNVVHFDAHADLGYSADRCLHRRKSQRVDCEDWLWHALDQEIVDEVTVVYPDWKGTREWESIRSMHHLCDFTERVHVATWSEWIARSYEREKIEHINVARSAAWTPPWFDHDFLRFIAALPVNESTCLDCFALQKVGAYDACTPREWEAPAFAAYEEMLINAFKHT
jgi:hypothetical protein